MKEWWTTDNIIGFLMIWTLVAFVAMIFNIHIGWWDVLSGNFLGDRMITPCNARNNTC